ncbi:uncharacterized protein LOC130680987 [Manis pentadactyla]|uniref:uncharacterized protein LOC130680984 n=1 Tax=Manis pentadactyla TaxID=143292 RepID=UPI00255C9923|nr:uncharacterized protein LOC130680984 [Manis pentadactyla]XP_057348866.1 uncharacterized protein LOC130680985 [Manis pentadactyla]XP_057348867.1 uncharacterized protein LOC130680986 [Manis pentadactyla]XP_057348868.1 uncharacterized protein LOC130680987 [Manis pentadactyla]
MFFTPDKYSRPGDPVFVFCVIFMTLRGPRGWACTRTPGKDEPDDHGAGPGDGKGSSPGPRGRVLRTPGNRGGGQRRAGSGQEQGAGAGRAGGRDSACPRRTAPRLERAPTASRRGAHRAQAPRGDRAPGPAGCAQPGTGDCGRCGLRGVGRNAGGGAFAPGPPPPLLKTARAPSCSTRSSRPGAAAALPPAWTSRLTSRRISSPHLSSARNGPQLLLLHWWLLHLCWLLQMQRVRMHLLQEGCIGAMRLPCLMWERARCPWKESRLDKPAFESQHTILALFL